MSRQSKWNDHLCLEALHGYQKDCIDHQKRASAAGYIIWSKIHTASPSLSTILSTLSLTWNEALRLVAPEPALVPLAKRRWTEAACLKAIRLYEAYCIAHDFKATRDGYQRWQLSRNDIPSIDPIEKLGSWNSMRLRAAVNPEEVSLHFFHQANWSELDCLKAIYLYGEYCQAHNEKMTTNGYRAWQRGRQDTPSITSVEKFGSWKSMCSRATERLAPMKSPNPLQP